MEKKWGSLQAKDSFNVDKTSKLLEQSWRKVHIKTTSDAVDYFEIYCKYAEAYSKSCRTSKMDSFVKIVDVFLLLIFFSKMPYLWCFSALWYTSVVYHQSTKNLQQRGKYFESLLPLLNKELENDKCYCHHSFMWIIPTSL